MLNQHNYAEIKLILKTTEKNARYFNKIITIQIMIRDYT